MALGDVIRPAGAPKHPVARPNMIGARDAMTKALAAFLEGLTFRVDGGDDPQDRTFQLNPVSEEWPKPTDDLDYPTASIIDTTGTEQGAHNLTPTPLEETLGQFDELIGEAAGSNATVLWKESEATARFQVDFWCDTVADRQAIDALLPSAFSPGEERTGVLVEGPELYYSLPVRFTFIDPVYDDSAVTAYSSERRLRCVVVGDCDIVSLRMARIIGLEKPAVTVNDPNDPTE